jgi:cyclopropane fatty-acyl-phospholipid synthase-like methyltransferase
VDTVTTTDDVRRYYDQNTKWSEKLGQGGAAIHRAVWGEGVSSREQAFGYVDTLIAQHAARFSDHSRMIDLGCGVGASLLHLAALLPRSELVGITISVRQAERAQQIIAAASLGSRVKCVEGDYLDIPPELGDFHIAFAIESFVHSPSASAFFEAVARRLRPGGRLIVCDDFQQRAPRDPRETEWVGLIRRGWMARTMVSVDDATRYAQLNGLTLIDNVDLTGKLDLRRLRDRWLSLLVAAARPFKPQGTLWRSWMGGDALQHALVARLVEYRLVVFEKAER